VSQIPWPHQIIDSLLQARHTHLLVAELWLVTWCFQCLDLDYLVPPSPGAPKNTYTFQPTYLWYPSRSVASRKCQDKKSRQQIFFRTSFFKKKKKKAEPRVSPKLLSLGREVWFIYGVPGISFGNDKEETGCLSQRHLRSAWCFPSPLLSQNSPT
jgi:hypothetical protein